MDYQNQKFILANYFVSWHFSFLWGVDISVLNYYFSYYFICKIVYIEVSFNYNNSFCNYMLQSLGSYKNMQKYNKSICIQLAAYIYIYTISRCQLPQARFFLLFNIGYQKFCLSLQTILEWWWHFIFAAAIYIYTFFFPKSGSIFCRRVMCHCHIYICVGRYLVMPPDAAATSTCRRYWHPLLLYSANKISLPQLACDHDPTQPPTRRPSRDIK